MFCKICGKELNDQAVICPGCGCAVNNNLPTTKQKTKKETADNTGNPSTLYTVFKYLTVGIICFATMFLILSLIFDYIYVDHFLSTSAYSRFISGSIYASSYTNSGMSIACLIFSILSYSFACITFALGFKSENKSKRFSSDVLFIIVNFLLILAIVASVYSW
mgnify:CR=1 FL=1